MVKSLAQTVTRQNEAITEDFRRSHRNTAKYIQQVSTNLITEGVRLRTNMRNYAADICFFSHLNINAAVISAEDLISRLEAIVRGILDSILSVNPTTCSAEATQIHDHQGGNDPDNHEGENQPQRRAPASEQTPSAVPPTHASDQPLSTEKSNKGKGKKRPLEKPLKIGETTAAPVFKKPSSAEAKKKKKDKDKGIADEQLIAVLRKSKAMASGKMPPHRSPKKGEGASTRVLGVPETSEGTFDNLGDFVELQPAGDTPETLKPAEPRFVDPLKTLEEEYHWLYSEEDFEAPFDPEWLGLST
ncbi:hypothetical protein OSB04_019210 [Centaurea solstitialis]|uniref:Uncharacterized protein n=1 Tax=Centaurea solstitialis TaxID=347529 RepID=A0AA38W2N1_9ASTR|nr:hypothetical protein OSB04_019210 [Centaurea solstitialis]